MIKNKNFRNVSMPSFRRSGGHAIRAFGGGSFDGWEASKNGSGSASLISSSIYGLSSFPLGGFSGSVSRSVFDKIFLGRGSWSRRRDW